MFYLLPYLLFIFQADGWMISLEQQAPRLTWNSRRNRSKLVHRLSRFSSGIQVRHAYQPPRHLAPLDFLFPLFRLIFSWSGAVPSYYSLLLQTGQRSVGRLRYHQVPSHSFSSIYLNYLHLFFRSLFRR